MYDTMTKRTKFFYVTLEKREIMTESWNKFVQMSDPAEVTGPLENALKDVDENEREEGGAGGGGGALGGEGVGRPCLGQPWLLREEK